MFKKIDDFLFEKITLVKGRPEYQKVLEKLSFIDESIRSQVQNFIGLILVAMPLLFACIYMLNLYGLEKDKKIKQQILSLVDKINHEKSDIRSLSAGLIANDAPADIGQLQNMLVTQLAAQYVSPTQLQILDFVPGEGGTEVNINTAKIVFKDFALKQYTAFIEAVEKNMKLKITGLEVTKNKDTKKLNGTVDVQQFVRPVLGQ